MKWVIFLLCLICITSQPVVGCSTQPPLIDGWSLSFGKFLEDPDNVELNFFKRDLNDNSNKMRKTLYMNRTSGELQDSIDNTTWRNDSYTLDHDEVKYNLNLNISDDTSTDYRYESELNLNYPYDSRTNEFLEKNQINEPEREFRLHFLQPFSEKEYTISLMLEDIRHKLETVEVELLLPFDVMEVVAGIVVVALANIYRERRYSLRA